MGRGLKAGLTCAVALAALRAVRRDGHGLYDMARAVDAALLEQFHDMRFVTGVLAELNLDTGHLRYINAGHPPPLLLRHGRAVRALTGGRRMPMGIDDCTIEVAEGRSWSPATGCCCIPTASPRPGRPTERRSAPHGSMSRSAPATGTTPSSR